MRSAAAVVFLAWLLAGCPATVGGTRCTESGSGGGADGGGGGAPGLRCVRIEGPGCDVFTTDQQRLVVYRDDGQPYYAGQALLLENCASCHGETSTARVGAPRGLDFDAELVRSPGAAGTDEARHLLRIQANIHRHRDLVYQQVINGAMPPRNFVPTRTRFVFPDGTPLPGIRDPDAHEILRRWLSCGSPVVERTTESAMPCSAHADCVVTHFCDLAEGHCVGVGDVVAARRSMLEPTWTSIYNNVIRTSCGGVAGVCHIDGSASGLNMDTQMGAYTALVGGMPGAMSVSCRAVTRPYVAAGDAEGSFLIEKLEGVFADGTMLCGSRMPIGPVLSTEDIEIIRMWIDAGAMND